MFLKTFKLKASLLKLWLIKNIYVFLKTFALIFVILILFGLIPFPISLQTLFTSISGKDDSSIINIASVLISILVAINTLSKGLKRLGFADVKNNETLKLQLVQLGLYFNKEGRLTKRIHRDIKESIEEQKQQTVSEIIEEEINDNLIGNLITATQDLSTIITAKVDVPITEEVEVETPEETTTIDVYEYDISFGRRKRK